MSEDGDVVVDELEEDEDEDGPAAAAADDSYMDVVSRLVLVSIFF